MLQVDAKLSTGLPELDRLLRGLMVGDNVVWQVERIEDYLAFVEPYCREAVETGRRLIYFRFARHKPLVSDDMGAEVHTLDPQAGFETFLRDIHATIDEVGRGAFYVFDCLSDLAVDWFSDQMLGNFFMLTCPYLYDLETVAYFALLRNYHSFYAAVPIRDTTQLLLDVYNYHDKIYVHPIKAQSRYSPTMHMLHAWDKDEFHPVTDSYIISEVLTSTPRSALELTINRLDVWSRTFLEAEKILDDQSGKSGGNQETTEIFHRLLRMIISRDRRVLKLAERYFELSDVLEVGKRTIGTGLIGGKSLGMLLARAILERTDPRWKNVLEVHDSFYIAADVFYTFLVRNGCWWICRNRQDTSSFLEGVETARHRIQTGVFPEYIEQQFTEMLDYFGQSPIIVRSSSLLEDNFGNSFAGKYESVFCANQGSREKRLEDFISAVKTVYASTLSERALSYRARHGLLDRDEQMALLVQRVSGSLRDNLFYPEIAGVGFSFNPYVWSKDIDPSAGMLRLVFGLGTRAVDRSDDDYTRVVALNKPSRRPEASLDDIRQYSQGKIDVLDLDGNQLVSVDFQSAIAQGDNVSMHLFATRDAALERAAKERGLRPSAPLVLTFDGLLTHTPFVKDMREMLRVIQEAYECPVDIEFTANFFDGEGYRVNLVQCRPLQVKSGFGEATLPPGGVEAIAEADMILETSGPVIGQSRFDTVDQLICVVPSVYGHLPISERYSVARLIGRLTRLNAGKSQVTMLVGPGRWGSTTSLLGVPVSFAEIGTVSILCEIVAMRDDLVPDVSLGTHFFNDLIEADMLYLALFPKKRSNLLNQPFFEESKNSLVQLLPDAKRYENVVHVINTSDLPGGVKVKLYADTFNQRVLCYMEHEAD
jgi:pyruvate,water dikinase